MKTAFLFEMGRLYEKKPNSNFVVSCSVIRYISEIFAILDSEISVDWSKYFPCKVHHHASGAPTLTVKASPIVETR